MLERFLWAIAGIASTALGLLGLLIPIIPGILFLLLAAVCFSRATKPQLKGSRFGYAQLAHAEQSFFDELRRDLHQQYRSIARQIARTQRRIGRR